MSGDHPRLRPRDPEVRAFGHERRPGFAECAPSGRVRLDALACWLQDVAFADIQDAGLEHVAVWVVRRTRIVVNRFPRFGGSFAVTTFCSGLGRMWAERRTDIVGSDHDRPDVEAVSLWVHLDAERGRPWPLTEAEIRTYTGTRPVRRVTARLRHPVPDRPDEAAAWLFRATERDIADHINNAAYWQPLEEEVLCGPDPDPARLDVEIEYRAPAQPGEKRVLRDGSYRWIVGADDELHASLRLGGPDGR